MTIDEAIPPAVLELLNASERGDLPETEMERRSEVRVQDMPASSLYVLRDELTGGAGGTGGGLAAIVEERKLTLALGFTCKGGWAESAPMRAWARKALGRKRLIGEDGVPLARKLELSQAVPEYGRSGSDATIRIVIAIAVTYTVRATDAEIRA